MLYAAYSLDECLLQCEVSKKSIRGILRYLGISIKKGINYACTEDWTKCRQICYFLDVCEKVYRSLVLEMTLMHSRNH